MGIISRWGLRTAKRYILPRWYVEASDDTTATVAQVRQMRDFAEPSNLKKGASSVANGIDKVMFVKHIHRKLISRG